MNDIERLKSKLSDRHIEMCAPVDISDIRSFEKIFHISLPPHDFKDIEEDYYLISE